MSEPAPAGPAAKKKGGDFADLKTRILSAVVMAVLAVGTLVAGGIAFTLFWLAAAIAICWEWQNLVGGARPRARFYVSGAAIALACSFAAQLQMEVAAAVAVVAAFVTAALADRGLRLWAGAGVIYAAALILALCALKPPMAPLRFATFLDSPQTTRAIVWLFAVVWGTDVMAYFGGRLIGGPKLWTRVSAGKTWSGTLVGVASGAALGLAVALFRNEAQVALLPMFLVGLAAAAVAQAGDLLESAVKRRFDVKDSSNLIPGHGGVMDRLDGFITSAALAAAIGAARAWPAVAEGLFQWR